MNSSAVGVQYAQSQRYCINLDHGCNVFTTTVEDGGAVCYLQTRYATVSTLVVNREEDEGEHFFPQMEGRTPRSDRKYRIM